MSPSELEAHIATTLQQEETIPAHAPIKEAIGKTMFPRTFALAHPSAPMLKTWATEGCPVDTGTNWTREEMLTALKRGPHISALSPDAVQALRDETHDKITNGYARVVKWGDIKDNLPPKLKLSPVAMVPHKSRKFRTILDLSFRIRHKSSFIKAVNDTTQRLAPAEAMVQLGNCLKRIISTMVNHYNPDKPFAFAKVDLKDGFWRMLVSNDDAWNFCYVMPSSPPHTNVDEIEIVVPNSLQMGWCESPPFFCAATETARDVIASLLNSQTSLPHHSLLQQMLENTETLSRLQATSFTVNILEVFVDDFIAATNKLTRAHLTHFSKALIHGIHSIFPPPEVSQHQGEDPISQKKMDAGDGTWAFTKEILGWIINGVDFTIHLTPNKCKALISLLRKVSKSQRCPLHTFQELAGKLQHASFGIPGGKGLFSPIYRALKAASSSIIITKSLRITSADWRSIIHQLASSPTPMRLLVPDYPNIIQYTDACALGAGGIICPGTSPTPHIVWQFPWPQDITKQISKPFRPRKAISINDLEMAAIVLGWLVLEHIGTDLEFKHIGTFCDNTSATTWTQKGISTRSIPSARLLRFLALRQRSRQASSLLPLHLPGKDNKWADIPSRAFKHGEYFHAQTNLAAYFNSHFPLPQDLSWREYRVPKKLSWRVISCLRGELLPMESLTRLPKPSKSTGNIGALTPTHANHPLTSNKSPPCTKPFSSQALPPASAPVLSVSDMKSKFKRSVMQWRPSPRPWNWEANVVPPSKQRENSLPLLSDAWKVSDGMTHQQSHNLQSQLNSSTTSPQPASAPPTHSHKQRPHSSPLPSTTSLG